MLRNLSSENHSKKVIHKFPGEYDGFLTEEIRNGKNQRTGFNITILNESLNSSCLLATTESNIKGPRVGKYSVNVKGLETAVFRAFPKISKPIRVIDEIGKMELLRK